MGPALQVVVLGIVQGLTEFLPVSSSGHLALTQLLFGVEDAGLTVSVMMHAGTLVATVVVLRAPLARAAVEGFKLLRRPRLVRESAGARDVVVVAVASIPTAIAGLFLRDAIAQWTSSPLALGFGFIATAALLVSTRWATAGNLETPNIVGALALGFAQSVALMPGVSRSGATIAAALWLGVRPDRAFELSMLLSVPAVLGAVILEGRHIAGTGPGIALACVGAGVACTVGLVALLLLRRVVVRGHFSLFSVWVLPVGLATLALAAVWPEAQ